MRERLPRIAAGLLALALLAALLATLLEIWPQPDWPGAYSGQDGFTAYEADLEHYAGTVGSILSLSLGFFCDLVPLAWIAWRGIHGRKSRLMLAGLALHAMVSASLLLVARGADESAAIGAAMLTLPLEFFWLCLYVAVLASRHIRDLLPSRDYGPG